MAHPTYHPQLLGLTGGLVEPKPLLSGDRIIVCAVDDENGPGGDGRDVINGSDLGNAQARLPLGEGYGQRSEGKGRQTAEGREAGGNFVLQTSEGTLRYHSL